MMTLRSRRDRELVCVPLFCYTQIVEAKITRHSEAKAKKELLEKAKGKGPLNTGSQGIKKSGKK